MSGSNVQIKKTKDIFQFDEQHSNIKKQINKPKIGPKILQGGPSVERYAVKSFLVH